MKFIKIFEQALFLFILSFYNTQSFIILKLREFPFIFFNLGIMKPGTWLPIEDILFFKNK